jgi:hypothetical protein
MERELLLALKQIAVVNLFGVTMRKLSLVCRLYYVIFEPVRISPLCRIFCNPNLFIEENKPSFVTDFIVFVVFIVDKGQL